jgi:eukaryotic-like serine/threonine-protein kinase
VSPRILIIDDHNDYRSWLEYHVAAAHPAAVIVGHDPVPDGVLPPEFDPVSWDLLFLDYRPGDDDGVAVLRELKSHPECPPIVLLTAQGDQETVVRALEAGADDFLAKGPTSHGHIARVVREAVHRGRRVPARPAAAPGEHGAAAFRLKGHRLLKHLGTGSTASVYLMEQERNARLVVAKVFRHAPELGDQLAPLERFLREYEVVSGIRHPNVVQIYDLGIDDDMAFIVMEYFACGHLGERIADGLPMGEALARLAQIAGALDAIHAVGVLHRDLKPANIMLRDDGNPALIDFGVAKLRDAAPELTGLGEIFGTPYYMSPEQGEGAPVDERADIYSLGVVFHEMLTGCKPYVAGSPLSIIWKHRHAPLPALPMSFRACQPLLDRLMAKSVEDRFPSARAVFEAVQELLSGGVAEARRIEGMA